MIPCLVYRRDGIYYRKRYARTLRRSVPERRIQKAEVRFCGVIVNLGGRREPAVPVPGPPVHRSGLEGVIPSVQNRDRLLSG